MTTPGLGPIRPTFILTLADAPEQAVLRLRGALEAAQPAYPHQIRGPHAVLSLPRGVRHFWSPWLTLEFQAAERGAVVHGRFSPKPAIWTGFMLSYIGLVTAACFALMFAASLAIIERPAGSWLGLAILLFGTALGMYAASQAGQRLAAGQMAELRAFLEASLFGDQASGAGGAVR